MEHLWSYLRRFSHMTKEMRPSHRTDVLYHALNYYGMKTKKLGTLLIRHWKRAEEMKSIATQTLETLISSLPVLSNLSSYGWRTRRNLYSPLAVWPVLLKIGRLLISCYFSHTRRVCNWKRCNR